jgi:hypothetical protein
MCGANHEGKGYPENHAPCRHGGIGKGTDRLVMRYRREKQPIQDMGVAVLDCSVKMGRTAASTIRPQSAPSGAATSHESFRMVYPGFIKTSVTHMTNPTIRYSSHIKNPPQINHAVFERTSLDTARPHMAGLNQGDCLCFVNGVTPLK